MPEAFFGLPEVVKFCRKCVISNQRPSSTVESRHTRNDKKAVIDFDADGVCAACRYNETKDAQIDWKKREDQLVALLDKHRRPNDYDVIVPGSGGKDSAYASHVLKYRYGMNPLTVTWSPHIYTEVGWKNFQNWIHIGGLDNILFTPNGKLHRLLTKLAFENLLHPFQPFIIGQRIIGPRMAAKYNVRLVMYGENQAEYGNNVDDNYKPTMDEKFFSAQDPLDLMLGGVAVRDIIRDHGFKLSDFAPYIPPTADFLREKEVEVHYLGYYLKWDPQECYYYASEHTGFVANPQRTEGTYSKYVGIDDRIEVMHFYTTLIKFGIGRATYDAAQEIRTGKITREEGVHLVHRYDEEPPLNSLVDFLEYVGIEEDEFWKTVDKFRSPHLWEKTDGKWRLRHRVESLGDNR